MKVHFWEECVQIKSNCKITRENVHVCGTCSRWEEWIRAWIWNQKQHLKNQEDEKTPWLVLIKLFTEVVEWSWCENGEDEPAVADRKLIVKELMWLAKKYEFYPRAIGKQWVFLTRNDMMRLCLLGRCISKSKALSEAYLPLTFL